MLSDIKIKQAKSAEKDYRLYDRDGLYIIITSRGSKLWRYKFRLHSKEYTYAIGKYPQVSLQQARQELAQARELVAQGINPTHARKLHQAQNTDQAQNTFATIAEEFIRTELQGQSAAYAKGIRRDFDNYAYPVIGALPIRQITPAHIMACLDKCKNKGIIVTGINLRQRMSRVFMYAIRTMRAEIDPTLPFAEYFKRPKIRHAAPMSRKQITDFVQRLKGYNGARTTQIALWLLLYTAVRSIEIRRAEWADFRLSERLWVIPADKMKRRRTHIVPLSEQAMRLLQELQRLTGGCRLLFPNSRRADDMMSATTLNRALEYIGIGFTAHDFRATLSTHLNEQGYDERHIEMQLAHAKTDNTQAAYNHAQFLEPRRKMMQEWADWVDGADLLD